MFEIGNSLREARLRQGFELPRVEADTKIRAKYLRALEEEHFDVLPGDTYVKGFLRTYAEYLGLDGQLYVDEYISRFAREEEFPVQSATARPRPRNRRMESNFVVVALAGIVAVTILVVVAWKFGTTGSPTSPALLDGGSASTTQSSTTTGRNNHQHSRPSAPAKRIAKVTMAASGGDCWIQVRAGSARGELIYEGTLQQGQAQRFTKWKRLWMQLGAPAYLRGTVNGHRIGNMPNGPAIVTLTAKGLQLVSVA